MPEKHISTVIHGQKNISVAFAKKLEYAREIEASFWMNLQANYDRELLEFEELNNMTPGLRECDDGGKAGIQNIGGVPDV